MMRVLCYCEDCQAFLHQLGRPELMDDDGGTDIVQVAPASVEFREGRDKIVGLRLIPKGLYRWHSSCCNTPLGNTLTPWLPFIGIGPEAWKGAGGSEWQTQGAMQQRNELFGPIQGASFTQHAKHPPEATFAKSPQRMLLSAVRKMLGWKLRGATWPHPFFDQATKAPRFPIRVLSTEERETLRPQCGPTTKHQTAARLGHQE